MPAPADKTGFPKTPASRPEPPPRPADSGPGSLTSSDATLSPYLRRRLRSLAEALRDSDSRSGEAEGPVSGAASPPSAAPPPAESQDPPEAAPDELPGQGRKPR